MERDDHKRIMPSDNLGDRRKQQEADRLSDELSQHQLDECQGSILCETCKRLEKALEYARYVGD